MGSRQQSTHGDSVDDERSTPSKDPVEFHEGWGEECDLIYAAGRQLAGISCALLEIARRSIGASVEDRQAALSDTNERLRGLAFEILGPGYFERTASRCFWRRIIDWLKGTE